MNLARARLQVLVAIVVALACLSWVQTASAAPLEPILELTQLRTALTDAPGQTLHGHLKTVLKGSTISTVAVEVLAVTGSPVDDLDPSTSLILFEAHGAEIDRIGGIAEGMSGSPIYVNISGSDYLVGALSYGDWFTTSGTGLATPIQAMSHVESLYQPTVRRFQTPVMTDEGLKTQVIITDDEDVAAEAGDDTIIASPRSSLYVGGANSRSALYRRLEGSLKDRGANVVPLATSISTSSERFETTLTAGAALTALITRGDLWFGGIGTITYVNGDNVVAFGHPFWGDGDTDYYMSNAWIEGIWPSTMIPYKLGTPGKLRGTIVEDRSTGIMGVAGDMREDSVIKAYAERTYPSKTTVATSTVAVPKSVINSTEKGWDGIAAYASGVAAWRLFDEYPAGGSALTTTTITVSDDTGTYEVTRSNIWDSDMWVADYTAYDADSMIRALQNINDAGLYNVDIDSVEVTSSLTSSRNVAQIVDLSIDGGLRHGDQTVTVSLLKRGVIDTQTIEVPLSIPTSLPLNGDVVATGAGYDYSMIDEEYLDLLEYYDYYDYYYRSGSRSTLAEVIEDLESEPSNNQLQVAFVPDPVWSDDEEEYSDSGPKYFDPVFGTKDTDTFLIGEAEKTTRYIEAEIMPSTTTYLGEAFLDGYVEDLSSGNAQFYLQYSGETSETYVGTAAIRDFEGMGMFFNFFEGLTKNGNVRVVVPGDDYYIATSKLVPFKVAARQSLSSSSYSVRRASRITLSSSVLPKTVTGNVVFERYVNGRWSKVASRPLVDGKATYRFPLYRSTKFRARTSGYPTNAAGKSRTITVRVR